MTVTSTHWSACSTIALKAIAQLSASDRHGLIVRLDKVRALVTGACRYQSVKSILKNSLDALPLVEPPPSSPPPPHDNIRGAEYFD